MQAIYQDIDLLGNWEGYTVHGIRIPKNQKRTIRIHLRPVHEWWGGCSRCGCSGSAYGDSSIRIVRDLPVFGRPVELSVTVRRVLCPACGPSREAIPWLSAYSRVTNRLAQSVCVLAEVMTIKHVAQEYRLSWHTVKEIHKRHLKALLDPVDLGGVTQLLIDEFAIQKGHRYATVASTR
ncbi:MAG: helix-turn-helix domain-containing protein [Spirochaetaceae bacterium]